MDASTARYDVDGFGGIAVVYAGKAGLFALLVEDLDFINNFCGHIAQDGTWVVSEEWFAIYQHLFDVLPLGLYFAIHNGYPRHFLHEVFSICVRIGFKRIGIELGGIAFLHTGQGLFGDLNSAELGSSFLHSNPTNTRGLGANFYTFIDILKAEVGHMYGIIALSYILKAKSAIYIGSRNGFYRIRQVN